MYDSTQYTVPKQYYQGIVENVYVYSGVIPDIHDIGENQNKKVRQSIYVRCMPDI